MVILTGAKIVYIHIFKSLLKTKVAKEKFWVNPVLNIWEFYKVLVQFPFTGKWYKTQNVVYNLHGWVTSHVAKRIKS